MFAFSFSSYAKNLISCSFTGFWPILSTNPYGQGDWKIIGLLPGKTQPSPVVRTQQAVPGTGPSKA